MEIEIKEVTSEAEALARLQKSKERINEEANSFAMKMLSRTAPPETKG